MCAAQNLLGWGLGAHTNEPARRRRRRAPGEWRFSEEATGQCRRHVEDGSSPQVGTPAQTPVRREVRRSTVTHGERRGREQGKRDGGGRDEDKQRRGIRGGAPLGGPPRGASGGKGKFPGKGITKSVRSNIRGRRKPSLRSLGSPIILGTAVSAEGWGGRQGAGGRRGVAVGPTRF